MIELLVTIAILALMVTVTLADFRSFGKKAALTNAAESVIIAIRQAQVYGSTTKGASSPCGASTSPFDCAYGVHVDPSTRQIIIFADVDSNNVYDSAQDGDPIETIPITSDIDISINCILFGTPYPNCGVGKKLNVTFFRPNPDAVIRGLEVWPDYQSSVIALTNGVSSTTVTITQTGQISLK